MTVGGCADVMSSQVVLEQTAIVRCLRKWPSQHVISVSDIKDLSFLELAHFPLTVTSEDKSSKVVHLGTPNKERFFSCLITNGAYINNSQLGF